MKRSLFSFILLLFLITGCAVEQPKFEATPASTGRALLRGEIKEAMASYESQAREAEKNAAASSFPRQYWEAATDAYRQASSAARQSGQLQEAISYAEKAREMAEKTKEPRFRLRAITRLIQAYRSVRNFDKAREHIEKGLEIVKDIPPNTTQRILREALLYLDLGRDLMQRREYEKAIDAFSQSVHLQEDYLARLSLERRVSQSELETARTDAIGMFTSLGDAYRRAGKLQDALEQYRRTFNSIKEWGLKYPHEGNLYEGMGEIFLQQKDFPQALENFSKALALAEGQRTPAAISSASVRIGDVLRSTGRPAEAIPHYQKAIRQIESTRSLLQSEEYRQSYFEGGLDAYVNMINTLLAAGKQEEAFNYGERARSRAFLDILGSKVQLARGGTLLEHERALQARISILQAMMAEAESDTAERGNLRQELEGAQKAYNDFLAMVRKENKEQASLMNVEPLTLTQVQELLDPGVTVLEFFVVRQQVLLWVVERDRVRFVRIPLDRSELVSKVTSLRENIFQIGEGEKFRGHSQELYRLLIEPALPHIRGKELLIIPHDALHYLPYQALLSPEGRYLIQDYPIYYLSSASLMQFTREKRRASKEGKEEKALVMGNPSLGDDAYNLRFAEREAKEVVRVYPKSAVYLRSEATKSRAISLSPNYDILHFAVHGELSQDDPLSSGLLLAGGEKGDGKLKASEIFSLNLKADTVVLSACETGLGKITNGDEIIGLTRAFIYAGTPSVITTLWKVNDRASYELMREFYSNLKTAKKSEALRQAQLKIMKNYPHPFFWAAYELSGEP